MVTYKEITQNGSYSDTAITNNVWVIDQELDNVDIDDVDYGVRATTEEELRHGSDAYVVKNLNNSGVTITDWNQYQETRVDAPANSVVKWDSTLQRNVLVEGAYAEASKVEYYVSKPGPGSGYKTLDGYTLTKNGIVDGGGNPLTSYYFSDVDITLTFEQMRNSNFKYNNGDGPNFYDSEGTPLVGYHEYGPHEIVTTKAYDLNTPDDTLYIQNVTGNFTVYFDVVSSEQKFWEDEQFWGYDGIHNSMVITADNAGVAINDWTAPEGSVVLNHFQVDAHPMAPVIDGTIEKIRIGNRIIDQTSFATAVTTIRAWLDTKYEESGYDDIYYNTRQVLDSNNEEAKVELKALYKSLITTTDLGLLDKYSASELTFTKSGNNLVISKEGETPETLTGYFADSKNTTVTTFNTESGIYEINEIANLDMTYDFAVGCGDTTITLGENRDILLNFISDEREGYVSQYQVNEAVSSDVTIAGVVIPKGGIMITRITGQPSESSKGLPVFNLTTDHLIITDYLTYGQGKVNFQGKAYNFDYLNDLLENVIGPYATKYPISFNTNPTVVAGEVFNGSFLNEKITGTSSDDTIYGNDGTDEIVGGQGNDTIYGGEGDDTINGEADNDIIYGGAGADKLNTGSSGNDYLYGGDGADTLNANGSSYSGTKYLYGGAGEDTISVGNDSLAYTYVAHVWGNAVDETHAGTVEADTFNVKGFTGTVYLEDATIDDLMIYEKNIANSYIRDNDNLIIKRVSGTTSQKTQTVIIKDHFTKTEETQFDRYRLASATTPSSIRATAEVRVDLSQFAEGYDSTDYKEAFSGSGTIKTSNSSDKIILGVTENPIPFEDYDFNRVGNNLEIVGDNKTITVNNFFNSESVIDDVAIERLIRTYNYSFYADEEQTPGSQLRYKKTDPTIIITEAERAEHYAGDSSYTTSNYPLVTSEEQLAAYEGIYYTKATIKTETSEYTNYKISEDAVINVNLSDFETSAENPYVATGYNEEFTGAGYVSGLTASDNIAITNPVYTRVGEASIIDINGTDGHIFVTDYNFAENTTVKVGGVLIASGAEGVTLNVVLNGAYAATDYNEVFTGIGSVSGMSANDKILTVGAPVFTRVNNGNLFVDTIEVKDFNWDGEHNINVNDGTTANMLVDVTLTDNFAYEATTYAENIKGTGSVSGMSANDKIITAGVPVFERVNNGGLFVDAIEVKDFNWDGEHNINVNDGTTANMLVDVTLKDNFVYGATVYAENIKGIGSVSGMGANDNVAVVGAYSRLNNGGLTVTGEHDTITIIDYFTTETNVKVNGAVIPDGTALTVALTDNTAYMATRFTETISGTGSVSGMDENDNVAVAGTYSRLNNGGLIVTGEHDTITITDYFTTEEDIKVNGAVIPDETALTVTLSGNTQYTATRFAETITGAGNVTVVDADINDKIIVGKNATYTRRYDSSTENNRSNDLVIADGENTITLKDYFTDDGHDVVFSDGKDEIDLATLTLNVENYNEYDINDNRFEFGVVNIVGTANADTYINDDGMATITGNAGADKLNAGEGLTDFVFKVGDGVDTIVDSKLGDVIELRGVDFKDVTFARSTVEGHTNDLIVTYSQTDNITIADYFDVAAGLRLATFLTSDGVHNYVYTDEQVPEEEIQEQKGNVVIDKETEGDVKIDATEYASTSTKGITVTNNSKTASVDVTGSDYDDKINAKYGNNTIVEAAGKNKVNTGAGDDMVTATDYSSNTINVGAGKNIVNLNSVGTNKVTAGNGENYIAANDGSNNVKLGNGANSVDLSGGVNTVKAGKGANDVDLSGGVNKVTTGKGTDSFVISDGNNTIKSGNGIDTYEISGGHNTINAGNGGKTVIGGKTVTIGNTIEINGGYNTVKSGSHADTITITDGSNNISTGAGADNVYLNGGVNTVSAGSGNDIIDFTGGNNYVDGGKGNDVYQVDMETFDFTNNEIIISDKYGKNVLDVTLAAPTDKLNIFFDVEVGKKGKAVFSDMLFTDKSAATVAASMATFPEKDFDGIEGIEVSSKKAISKIKVNNTTEYTINSKEIDKLASDIAGWLSNKGYASTDDVFANEKTAGDINTLIAKYTAFADNNYVYKAQA